MASVSIEFAAFLDPRFKILASLSGQSRFDAIGRMAAVWVYCIEKSEAVLPQALIDVVAEIPGYACWIIESGLGEVVEDGSVRIRGTEGRIEWLAKARARQKNATAAAKEKRLSNSSPRSVPILSPKSEPTLESSSASTSASASTIKTNTLVRRKRRTEYTPEFETLYDQYPRKEGKRAGFDVFLKLTDGERHRLGVAIRNYSEQCRREGRDVQHIKMFSSFMSTWEDYVNSSSQSASSASTPLHLAVTV